jgi:branched-chain amino acid aminotransferase
MSVIPFDQRDGFIWLDGEMVPWGEAKLHVLSHGLHYGSSVFEGERAYNGKIFKTTEHSIRLQSAYVRPVAWRGSEMMAVSGQHNKIHTAIAVWEWPSMFDPETKMKGIKLDIAEYRRPDPICAPVHAKAAGLYMICTISKHRAERKGYADAMMLDWQGRVAECTGANIFFIEDGAIHTPIADCFLDGITRQTTIELAKRRGYEVIERRIMPEEMAGFSECFITGSAAEVTPVSEIGEYKFTPSTISRQLMDDYSAEVVG